MRLNVGIIVEARRQACLLKQPIKRVKRRPRAESRHAGQKTPNRPRPGTRALRDALAPLTDEDLVKPYSHYQPQAPGEGTTGQSSAG